MKLRPTPAAIGAFAAVAAALPLAMPTLTAAQGVQTQGSAALPRPDINAAPAAPTPAMSESVAAVVNDEIISTYDLRQRLLLLIAQSGVRPDDQSLQQFQREALRSLVDDHLKLQEIRRVEQQQKLGGKIIPTDKEVDQEFADFARENNQTPERMAASLTAIGAGVETIKLQLKADMAWNRWIGGRYGGSRLRIGDDQVQGYLRRMNEQAQKPQYLLSEVFIDAARVGGLEQATQGAQQLIGQMQQGAPFAAVARQFSSAPTAANGGDAGWVTAADLPPQVQSAVETLRPGQLSGAIQTPDGVYILYLREKRAGADQQMVSLRQAAIALPADAKPDAVEAANQKLSALKAQVSGCDDLSAKAKAAGVLADDLGETETRDLSDSFRKAAETLKEGEVSDPIRTNGGLHLLAVCQRRAGGAKAPTRAEVENRLRGQQLTLVSRRYLRDLRNSATIETR